MQQRFLMTNIKKVSKNKIILYEYNLESKETFGKFFCINLSDLNRHEFFESHHKDEIVVNTMAFLDISRFEQSYF